MLLKRGFSGFVIALLLVVSATEPAHAGLETGLAAFYPFDGNARDLSGNENNGIVFGATLTEDRFGQSGRAFKFNGTRNWIKIPTATGIPKGKDPYTISLWAFITDYSKDFGDGFNGYLISRGEESPGKSQHIALKTDGRIWLNHAPTPLSAIGPNFDTGFRIKTNQWYHIVVVFNGVREKLYINGTKRFESPPLLISISNSAGMAIGKNVNYDMNYVKGRLDDVRFYDRELSESEFRQLFNLKQTIDMVAISDVNKNGSEEIAVLQLDATRSPMVLVSDGSTGKRIQSIPFLNRAFEAKALAAVSDLDGDNKPEIAVLGVNRREKSVLVQLKNASTGELIRDVGFSGTLEAEGLTVLKDMNNNGFPELGVLRFNAARGVRQMEIRDSVTGRFIKVVKVP